MRIAFYIAFNDPESPLIMADFIKSMWLGMRFDIRMGVLMLLPLFFLGGIKWFSPFNYKSARYVWLAYLSAIFSAYVMFYVFDFGHYAYLNTRLDFTAMRFVENMAISAEMVWESYPVIPITIAILVTNLVFIYLTNKLFVSISKQENAEYGYVKGFLLVL